jgi:TPR repeat protein
MLGNYYLDGIGGLHQDAEKAKEHWTQAAKFGTQPGTLSHLGRFYKKGEI